MNTALLDSAADDRSLDASSTDKDETQIRTPPKPANVNAKARPAPLPIAVLTNATAFADQIRVALDSEAQVTAISTVDDAVALASTGRCSILVTDTTVARNVLETLAQRLRTHDPAVALVVSGSRDHCGLFIALQSSGAVDAFLLKPITPAATQLVIEAATRRYRSYGTDVSQAARKMRERAQHTERAIAVAEHFESDATIESKRNQDARQRTLVAASLQQVARASKVRLHLSWLLVAIVASITVGFVTWTLSQRGSGIDPNETIAKHLARADAAIAAKRLLDARDGAVHHYRIVLEIDPSNLAAQRGLDAVAHELGMQAQAHMLQQRLADAAIALARLRELQPSYAELPLLDSQLKILQDSFVASHIAIQTLPAPMLLEQEPEAHDERIARRPEARTSNAITQPQGESVPTLAPAATENSHVETQSPLMPATDALTAPVAQPQIRSEIPTTAAPLPSTTTAVAPEVPHSSPARPERAKLIKYVAPQYPTEAYARRMEGWIEISMEIAPSGDVIAPRIEAGEKRQLFARSALAAVRQWKYEPDPTRAAGERTSVRVQFQMK